MIEFGTDSKSFWTGTQRKVILDRGSFRVTQGKSLGILGPNGTGKSTVINMMAGLENARFIAQLYGLDPDYLVAFCRWLCNLVEYFDMPVGTYSAGMRGRLSFALLLALDFDFHLIDEGIPRPRMWSSTGRLVRSFASGWRTRLSSWSRTRPRSSRNSAARPPF